MKTPRLTNLDYEAFIGEGIVMEYNAASVANDLGDTASKHAAHKTPALPADSKIDVNDPNDREEGNEDDVAWERREVGVHGPFEGADVEGAEVL